MLNQVSSIDPRLSVINQPSTLPSFHTYFLLVKSVSSAELPPLSLLEQVHASTHH
jgi:hypothetical protein